MKAIGFDNQKYLTMQSEQIRHRIAQFGGKLYLEFGGKLFDDFHASRVLPGFQPDSKIRMLQQLKNDVEIVITINAADIESSKVRGDLGITYDEKAFYDILISVAEKHQFKEQLSEDKYIYLAKEIKKLVANKSKYTDWTNRQDVKDELYTDVAILLNKNGFPPQPIDEAYDEIMKQVDNYKKNHDSD